MKYFKYIVWALLILLVQTLNVSAVCTYKEQASLNESAGQVKATYDILEEGTGEYGYYGEDSSAKEEITTYNTYTNIANINDNIYIKFTNITESGVKIYRSSDSTNGLVRFKNSPSIQIYKYKIEIYSALANCNNELLKTINLVIPKFNDVSELGICSDIPDYKYCQTFINEDLTSNEIFGKVSSYLQEKTIAQEEKKNEEDNKKNVDYKNIIMWGSIALTLLASGAIVYAIIKRKKVKI